ncbi:NINE protein [Parachitinimonas caeni]|uniref:NINE protein n=1 Tax=Parachitinimonas caeni TaxID=3031301 RepID=A0ABT7DRL2_9NEIS|nr:NINE protein [Parachitinimonas caeni]MDK2122707.1 NINE protein [Parachitinimonas caeni]
MQNPNHPVWLHRLLAPLIRLVLRHQPAQARPVSPKIPELALLLCLLLGWAGVHRWYLGSVDVLFPVAPGRVLGQGETG